MPHTAMILREVPEYTRPSPLSDETWDQYVEADAARGNSVTEQIVLEFEEAHRSPESLKVLFAGHTGCGKSTELVRVRRKLKDKYLVKLCTVDDRYSLTDLEYRPLLFLCAQMLVEAAKEAQVELPKNEAEFVENWFDKKDIEEVRSQGAQVEVEAGGKVGFLTALFARFQGRLYSGGETREKVIKHIEERLDQLMGAMRVLTSELEKKIAPRRFLLVLENLDKIEDIDRARRIYLDHRPRLLGVPFSVIYTCPIRLWYDAEGLHNYPVRKLLPMIAVSQPPLTGDWTAARAQAKAALGRETLREIVYNRVAPPLVADDALESLISWSGGVLRDLLYMLRNAAVEALIKKAPRIELIHARVAALRLRSDYANRISPPSRSGAAISYADILQAVGQVKDWPKTAPNQTPAFRQLLQSLCILEYNGETWHDLHPLVREHWEIREKEEARRAPAPVTPGP